MHAELQDRADSVVMISDATEEHPAMQSMLHLYVPDIDVKYKRAVAAGATTVMEPTDQFYGDRTSGVKDPPAPCGTIATL
jgi:uncharacterized glyoxalase superfamily protein PhnB